jgi:hypothetical protein
MKKYINTITREYPLTEWAVKTLPEFDNICFPDPFVPPEGYAEVLEEAPQFDVFTQVAVEGGPRLDPDGQWRQTWVISPRAQDAIVADVQALVQQRLDDFFRTRDYDGVLSAATYATSTVPKFQAEGQYAVNVRDAHWAVCYDILAEATANGVVPSLAEIEARLPALVWPDAT